MRVCVSVLIAVFCCCQTAFAVERRQEVLNSAQAYWKLGDGGQTATHPLRKVGSIAFNVPAEGERAIVGAAVARLAKAYFDAGKSLNISGDRCTVYLRARDPSGQWESGLFAKRGHHDIINFNLYATSGIFGVEFHADGGLAGLSFSRSEIAPTAWHDLIGRYDGKSIDLICDGRIMATRPWIGGKLTQNEEPVLIGAETNEGQAVRPFTGEMEEAAVWSRALCNDEIAALARRPKIDLGPKPVEVRISPLHYRPKTGNAGDAIPFYWQGQYHVFYLHESRWDHIVTTDLIHWQELPPALSKCADPRGPDGEACWTGSVIEHDGAFHLFYTGKNASDPAGDQKVMVATSKDLIHWDKQPDRTFYADGTRYWSKPVNGPAEPITYHHQAFRDPDVFWNAKRQQWWMMLHALAVDGMKPCIGLYTSRDLLHWTASQPLTMYSPFWSIDCPHAVPIDGRLFIIMAGAHYTSADKPEGPYPVDPVVYDCGDLLVPKSAFDGKRRLIWGWIRDLENQRDAGKELWGGTISMAHEIYAGPHGQLYSRPTAEISAAFTDTAMDLSTSPALHKATGNWKYANHRLSCGKQGGVCSFDTPDDYMLQCSVQLDPEATLTVVMRQQDQADAGYPLSLCPKSHDAELRRADFHAIRKIDFDVGKPITIQAFVQGAIIECFVNDRFAFTCRAYDFSKGRLGLKVEDGNAKVIALTVKTLPSEKP